MNGIFPFAKEEIHYNHFNINPRYHNSLDELQINRHSISTKLPTKQCDKTFTCSEVDVFIVDMSSAFKSCTPVYGPSRHDGDHRHDAFSLLAITRNYWNSPTALLTSFSSIGGVDNEAEEAKAETGRVGALNGVWVGCRRTHLK
jgi:hypothetical protein